jgi:hypothetical protein
LRNILTTVVRKSFPEFTFQNIDGEADLILEGILKIHQIMALVDVTYPISEGLSDEDLKKHCQELSTALDLKSGLNYLPRERTIEGRVFEHASDTKILIQHLASLKISENSEPIEITQSFKVELDTNDEVDGVFSINKEFLSLTVRANGKADLYFHAYVWTQYLKSLKRCEVTFENVDYRPRLNGLSKTLGKVI